MDLKTIDLTSEEYIFLCDVVQFSIIQKNEVLSDTSTNKFSKKYKIYNAYLSINEKLNSISNDNNFKLFLDLYEIIVLEGVLFLYAVKDDINENEGSTIMDMYKNDLTTNPEIQKICKSITSKLQVYSPKCK